MAIVNTTTIEVPYSNEIIESDKKITVPWQQFFRKLYDLVSPMGFERSFQLENNVASAADVEGLQVNSQKINQVIIEYVIQRITTSTGATELIESGLKIAVYKPVAASWSLVTIGTPGPDGSGVTLSITAGGQVRYTSTNITGTPSVSKITYRARTLAAKVNL